MKPTHFNELFTAISPEEIGNHGNVFTMVGKEFFVITAGKPEHYNAMVGSGGGMGMLFRKAATWCVVRSDRYTLELIQREQTYTLTYFPEAYREQMFFLGSKSGRDSGKMNEVELTAMETPSGNISFEDARLIIECRLVQITTPDPGDFYSQEAKEYIREAYKEASDHRKYVFGEITGVWVR